MNGLFGGLKTETSGGMAIEVRIQMCLKETIAWRRVDIRYVVFPDLGGANAIYQMPTISSSKVGTVEVGIRESRYG